MRDVNLDQMSNQYFDVLKEIGRSEERRVGKEC